MGAESRVKFGATRWVVEGRGLTVDPWNMGLC